MHDTDKISVIVPFYNGERYVEGCIKCLLNQTFGNIQIIMVDDGSVDKGAEIVRRYMKEHTNIELIRKNNSGQGDSRNVGMKRASGKYIYYLDVDDFIARDALEKLFCTAEEYDAELVVFDSVSVKEDSEVYENSGRIPDSSYLGGGYTGRSIAPLKVMEGRDYVLQSLSSAEGFFPPVWIGFYKRNFLIENKLLFEKIIYEDDIYSMETALAASKVVYLNKVLHIRRIVSTSITNQKKTERHIQGALRAAEYAMATYNARATDEASRNAFYNWSLHSGRRVYDVMKQSDRALQKKYKQQYVLMLIKNREQFNWKLILRGILL